MNSSHRSTITNSNPFWNLWAIGTHVKHSESEQCGKPSWEGSSSYLKTQTRLSIDQPHTVIHFYKTIFVDEPLEKYIKINLFSDYAVTIYPTVFQQRIIKKMFIFQKHGIRLQLRSTASTEGVRWTINSMHESTSCKCETATRPIRRKMDSY